MNNPQLEVLKSNLCARMDSLLSRLEVRLRRTGKFHVGCCPIHGGDNGTALNLFPEGETQPGYWRCWTHQCERTFRPTILGFVHGVLSARRGWSKPGDRMVPFQEVLNFCCSFLGKRLDELKVEPEVLERLKFSQTVQLLRQRRSTDGIGMTRSEVRHHLLCPSSYFLARHFSADILSRYDVGDCRSEGKYFSGRAVVPIYCDRGERAIGYTGRSVHPHCPDCDCWHPPGPCPPTERERLAWCKWKNLGEFRESHLYNWWSAKKSIERCRVAILVEGPADVWRLEEAGIRVGLAILGCRMSEEQQILLESSGAMTVLGLLDGDRSGQEGWQEMAARMARCFRMIEVKLPHKDSADMKPDELADCLEPFVKKYSIEL